MDLLIVGAGPAGCAAAIAARMQGFTVKLLDVFSHFRRLPGESLHPGVEPLLRQLGVWTEIEACGFLRHSGIWRIGLDGSRQFEAFGSDSSGIWRGFQVDRVKLHQILRKKAVEIGAQLFETRVITLENYRQNDWTIKCDKKVLHHASAVMDASGRRAWLARQLGLAANRLGEIQRVQFGWDNVSSTSSDPVFSQQSNGWEWNALVGENKKAWVRLKRGEGNQGLDVTPRIFYKCAGTDWFLLGDAACLTTPASGNGVLRALMSGIYSVHIHKLTTNGLISKDKGAADYCTWMRNLWSSSVSATEGGGARHLRRP